MPARRSAICGLNFCEFSNFTKIPKSKYRSQERMPESSRPTRGEILNGFRVKIFVYSYSYFHMDLSFNDVYYIFRIM